MKLAPRSRLLFSLQSSKIELIIINLKNMTEQRRDYIDWDEAFMQISRVISQRSKDPSTQTGACIVDNNKVIIGLGYNGFPRGCSDNDLPWSKTEDNVFDKKYAYVVHAEANAILNSNAKTKDTILYCTLFPCNECTKLIIQSGIKEVVYESDKYHDEDIWKASRRMLELAGISCRQYRIKNKEFIKNLSITYDWL
jgi:dCMP deaminase